MTDFHSVLHEMRVQAYHLMTCFHSVLHPIKGTGLPPHDSTSQGGRPAPLTGFRSTLQPVKMVGLRPRFIPHSATPCQGGTPVPELIW